MQVVDGNGRSFRKKFKTNVRLVRENLFGEADSPIIGKNFYRGAIHKDVQLQNAAGRFKCGGVVTGKPLAEA